MTEPELSEFIEKRGLSENVSDWTANIPSLELSRPPLSPILERRLLRQSQSYLKQFNGKTNQTYNLRKRIKISYKY